jgi:hypothetical protein
MRRSHSRALAVEGPKTVFPLQGRCAAFDQAGQPADVVTLDTSGNIWLGGLNRKNSHSVIKAVPVVKATNRPLGFTLLTTSQGIPPRT